MEEDKIKITPELARIHAHICADGYIGKSRSRRSAKELLEHPRKNLIRNRYYIRYVNKDSTLVKQFIKDVEILFNRKVIKLRRHEYEVCGKWIYDILKSNGALKSDTWFIPDIILNSSKKVKRQWLRTIFDDEGWVGQSNIGLSVANKKGIRQIISLLSEFGIETRYTIRKMKNPKHKTQHQILLRKKDTITYHFSIGFNSLRKKDKLANLIRKWNGDIGIRTQIRS